MTENASIIAGRVLLGAASSGGVLAVAVMAAVLWSAEPGPWRAFGSLLMAYHAFWLGCAAGVLVLTVVAVLRWRASPAPSWRDMPVWFRLAPLPAVLAVISAAIASAF